MKELDVNKLYQLAGERARLLETALDRLTDLIAENFQLKMFFEDIGVKAEHKLQILKEVYPDVPPLMLDFFQLLVANDMMNRLNCVRQKYRELVSLNSRTQMVEIASATALTPAQKEQIEKYLGHGNRTRYRLRPDIIGGVRIHWQDGRYLDATLSGALKQLEVQLLV